MIKYVDNFSVTLDGNNLRLPKGALYMRQAGKDGFPMRFLYVQDIRTCGEYKFKIFAYIPFTGEKYTFLADVRTSAIARAFAKFADSLPLECIHAPIWPIYHRDSIGQPCDRKPQKFDAKRKKPDVQVMEERSVTDWCQIGCRKYRELGYNKLILDI